MAGRSRGVTRKAPSPQLRSTTVTGRSGICRGASDSTASTSGAGGEVFATESPGAGRSPSSRVVGSLERPHQRAARSTAFIQTIRQRLASGSMPRVRSTAPRGGPMAFPRIRRLRDPGQTRWGWTTRAANAWATSPSDSRRCGASARSTGPSAGADAPLCRLRSGHPGTRLPGAPRRCWARRRSIGRGGSARRLPEAPAFAGAAESLVRLAEQGHRLVAFSNSVAASLGHSSPTPGCFPAHRHRERRRVETYKPSPDVYRHLVARGGLPLKDLARLSTPGTCWERSRRGCARRGSGAGAPPLGGRGDRRAGPGGLSLADLVGRRSRLNGSTSCTAAERDGDSPLETATQIIVATAMRSGEGERHDARSFPASSSSLQRRAVPMAWESVPSARPRASGECTPTRVREARADCRCR